MKKIIANKVYDTRTATEMASWDSDNGRREVGTVIETLYLKKTGEYFLHGEGGPNTKYANDRGGNRWGWGETIMPLSYEAARKWAEEHLTADDYEAIFGPVTEEEGKEAVTLYLPSALMARLRRESQETGRPVNAIIEARMG